MPPGGEGSSGKPGPDVPAALRPAAELLFGEACEPNRERGGEACEPNQQRSGDRLASATEYARLLTTDGVIRGLVGPREAPRIWERHLLNCAVVAELIPDGSAVVDVGSGAGLPGIVLAIARPDLSVTLVEPKERRTTFLTEAVARLALDDRVTVVRARAEEAPGRVPPADVATARALAPLDRLAGWCLPLVSTGGRVLAIKGDSAADEIAMHTEAIRRAGGGSPIIRQCGTEVLAEPATVVEIVRERAGPEPGRAAPGAGGGSRRRARPPRRQSR